MKKPSLFSFAFVALIFIFFVYSKYIIIVYHFSDYKEHIPHALHFRNFFDMSFQTFVETAPLGSAYYPGWHLSFLAVHSVISFLPLQGVLEKTAFAAAITDSCFNIATLCVICRIFNNNLTLKNIYLKKSVLYILALFVLFEGPLKVSAVNPLYNFGQFASGVWHNPTTQPVKLFAVLTLYLYGLVMRDKERLQNSYYSGFIKIRKLDAYLILLSVLLLLSVIYKTSFIIVFAPALFIYCCIFFFAVNRFKNFGFYIKIGLSLIPACLLVLWQNTFINTYTEGGIGFSPMTVWGLHSPRPFWSVVISFPFPIYVIALTGKKILKNEMLLLSIIATVVSITQFALFVTYPNIYDGNWGWGAALSVLMLFTACVSALLEYANTHPIEIKKNKAIIYTGFGILFIQFAYGIQYYTAGLFLTP